MSEPRSRGTGWERWVEDDSELAPGEKVERLADTLRSTNAESIRLRVESEGLDVRLGRLLEDAASSFNSDLKFAKWLNAECGITPRRLNRIMHHAQQSRGKEIAAKVGRIPKEDQP